ncbi:MAG: SusC/RagA family TonB-linked outer membrane protein [Pseudosphingobacterium sp.]|nr:SusC/RagA family TonB-linked outer membrane protein [Pseudosphingobacterium sp.]
MMNNSNIKQRNRLPIGDRVSVFLKVLTMVGMMGIIPAFLQGQEKPVRGQVRDSESTPLEGVTVQVKGTRTATATNANGNFSINASNGDILVFSLIGYQPRELTLQNQMVVNIQLTAESRSMEEVVVTALGIKKESKKLGYSAETVKRQDLLQNRTVNVMESLEGKVAGLDISPPAAGAGSSTKIRLRGQSAFAGAANSPLIVINGLPMDQGARSSNGWQPAYDLGDNMQQINPDDIESMTVLKGATAAAIYGSRAANGAIIITTKNGQRDQGIGIEYTSNFTVNSVLDFTDFQQEFGQGQGRQRPTDVGSAISTGMLGWGSRMDGEPIVNFDGVMRPYAPNPNRIKEFYRDGTVFTNTVALSGGSDKGNFRASFSNSGAKGITPAPDNRYTKRIFNLGLNHDLTKKLHFSFNANYTKENNENPPQVGAQGPGAPNFLTRMSTSIPLAAFRESAVAENGTERQTSGFQGTLLNPYFAKGREFILNDRDRFLGTATLRYDVMDWLYVQGRYNYDYSVSKLEFNTPTGRGTSTPFNNNGQGPGFNGMYHIEQAKGTEINTDFLVGASKEFGDFSIDLSVGGNIFKRDVGTFIDEVEDFTVRDLYSIQNGINKTINNYTIFRDQTNSLYAFAEFGYKGMLYVNLTGRQDWFSVLNPEANSEFYPSVSGSFIFSELMKEQSWLSYGKLRGSWAQVGSANGIPPFSNHLFYDILPNQLHGRTLGTILGTRSPNALLRPFSVEERELGLELRFFDSRLSFDIAAYEKVTTDQILPVQISNASGYTDTQQNVGSLQNRGMEFMLEVIPVKRDNFRWTSSFNASLNTTKVLSIAPGTDRFVAQRFEGNEFIGALVYEVGLPLNQLSANTYLRNENGEILLNDNGRLLQGPVVNFGSALPKWVGGWTNTFTYKNLSLSMHFDFKAGGKVLSSSALNGLRQGHTKASLIGRREGENGVVFDGVYRNGEKNTIAVNPQDFYTDYRNLQIADPFIFKSDFIKFRNIALTYNLSDYVKNKFGFIKGLTLTASCRNVALLYKDLPDYDPEAFASSGDNRVGYEQATVPTTRNYAFNLNIIF